MRDTFEGIYAGSRCEICAQNPLQTPLAYSQAMLGIPTLKKDSDKVHGQGETYYILTAVMGGA